MTSKFDLYCLLNIPKTLITHYDFIQQDIPARGSNYFLILRISRNNDNVVLTVEHPFTLAFKFYFDRIHFQQEKIYENFWKFFLDH